MKKFNSLFTTLFSEAKKEKTKTLYKGEYVEVVTPVDEVYETLHEKNVIIVLPILIEKNGRNKIGIRHEHVPPYGMKDKKKRNYYTVLSGGIEKNEDPSKTMLRELKEESGIVPIGDVAIRTVTSDIPLCKSTDMRAWIYFIEIGDHNVVEPEGDGSKSEAKSKMVWIDELDIDKYLDRDDIDFLLFAMLNLYKMQYPYEV